MTKRKVLLLLAAVFAVVVGGFAAYDATRDNTGMLKLYGSIDMRTVELAFEESGRIEEVLVEEGMRVAAGQQLATLSERLCRHFSPSDAKMMRALVISL